MQTEILVYWWHNSSLLTVFLENLRFIAFIQVLLQFKPKQAFHLLSQLSSLHSFCTRMQGCNQVFEVWGKKNFKEQDPFKYLFNKYNKDFYRHNKNSKMGHSTSNLREGVSLCLKIFLVFIYFTAFWKWFPKKKIASISPTFLDLHPVEISPLGGYLPCEHSFFAHRPMQICLYPHKYPTQIHKKLVSGWFKGQRIQIYSQNGSTSFHAEIRGWKFYHTFFSSNLWPQISSCWYNILWFCTTKLVISINISLLIMFFNIL